jgi:hypothetical protein
MTVATGTEVYNVDNERVVARGRRHSAVQRDVALNGAVRSLIQDDAARKIATDLTASLAPTGFSTKNLDAILNNTSPPQGWEVGEAYLTAQKKCHFPWSDQWDERKDKSSLPGADLVGLQETDDKTLPFRLAFGEIKTSGEGSYPPGVMYGEKGLKKQLDDLRDRKRIRDKLFKYLMVRAIRSDWKDKWKSAAARYLKASTDVAVFGVLIRDVTPDSRDLSARAKGAAKKQPAKMHIELLAIYLPAGSIVDLPTRYTPATSTKPVKKRAKKKPAPKKKGG